MPSVRYYNQTAPFWDFVANMEEQGASHPFFTGYNNRGETSDNENEHPTGPGEPGWTPFGAFGPFAHRGRHGPHHRHYAPPPPPPPPQPANGPPGQDEKDDDPEEGPSGPRGPPPPFSEKPEHGEGPRHRGPGGRCGGRAARGGWGGRGRHGPPGFGGPMGGFGGLANMFQAHLFGDESGGAAKDKSEDFKPDVDVFDAAEAFVIHVSLPGAKKEDVGVSWDAEKSELNIAGVIYRPGDEELLKTLALDERKIGAFERKVRLGSRANPAQVDADAITAKMDDGVLRVEVPKLDSGYVEIKKVDIE